MSVSYSDSVSYIVAGYHVAPQMSQSNNSFTKAR